MTALSVPRRMFALGYNAQVDEVPGRCGNSPGRGPHLTERCRPMDHTAALLRPDGGAGRG